MKTSQKIKKWIKALESKKYKKGKGILRDNKNKFCCLGVACDVFGYTNGWHLDRPFNGYISKCYDYEGNDTTLPDDIRADLNLSEEECSTLADLNDDNNTWVRAIKFLKGKVLQLEAQGD